MRYLLSLIFFFFVVEVFALSPAQLTALKTSIAADPVLSVLENTPDNAFAIADAYNKVITPDFWVWKTSVTEGEYTRVTSSDGTEWSWTAYIARSQGERDAWARLFMGGGSPANPSLPNVRQGVADIFSGGTGAAQRTHLLAVSRRKATRAEKLFATGTGSTASPATMGFEGSVNYTDVLVARNLE